MQDLFLSIHLVHSILRWLGIFFAVVLRLFDSILLLYSMKGCPSLTYFGFLSKNRVLRWHCYSAINPIISIHHNHSTYRGVPIAPKCRNTP